MQENNRIPQWDPLPPFEFINPRVRTAVPKESKHAENEGRPATKGSLADGPHRQQSLAPNSTTTSESTVIVCPACGAQATEQSDECQSCGLILGEVDSLADSPFTGRTLSCPHCGAQLELESGDDGVGEYTCTICNRDFTT